MRVRLKLRLTANQTTRCMPLAARSVAALGMMLPLAAVQPAVAQPATVQPIVVQPIVVQPIVVQPIVVRSAVDSSTVESSTVESSTVESSTVESSTVESSVVAASTLSSTRPPVADVARLDYRLQARALAADTWVIEGAVDDFRRENGCNVVNTAFIATGAGVVVLDTGPSRRYGEQQRRLIERSTGEPVLRVLNLNLHPDHFFGNQAWADRAPQALAGSIAGMRAEGEVYADNLYRLCGDWMQGTAATPARVVWQPGTQTLGWHRLTSIRLSGHTADDLVLIDHGTGVAFVGGLVFLDRVPTTPHANFAQWLQSLDRLEALHRAGEFHTVVPSHGPVHEGLRGIAQTRDWLQWLTRHLRDSAQAGLDLSELLAQPVPARFAGWAAQPAEWQRTLAQWYPVYEREALGGR